MGHGASTKPLVEALGEGRYVATEVGLFMAGRWEHRTTSSGPLADRATIGLQIP